MSRGYRPARPMLLSESYHKAKIFYYTILYISLCLWYNQRIIVYAHGFPFMYPYHRRISMSQVLQPDVPYEIIVLVTKDKVRLQCLLIPRSTLFTRGTVIMFHGNSMNHGDLVDPHAITFSNLGFTVLSAEYRGYGQSEGIPSESGLQLDAQAALDFVANDPELSKGPIVVYGHSLGGAVAIDVTSRNTDKVSALIVENAYSSIPSLVRNWHIGRFLSLLCTQKWYSAPKLAGMPSSLPILMLSGLRDRFIPPSEMVKLWEAAKRRPKKNTGWFGFAFGRNDDDESLIQPESDVFKTFDYGDHYYMCRLHGYWSTVTRFLDDVVPYPNPSC